MKIKTKLQQLQRVAPKSSRYGQLYRDVAETRREFKRVKLWTLFVSDDGEHMLRPHVFQKKEAHDAKWWFDWFKRHLEKIHREAILPGLSIRTDLSKQWAVEQILGWTGDVKHISRNSASRSGRNQAKQKRRKNG